MVRPIVTAIVSATLVLLALAALAPTIFGASDSLSSTLEDPNVSTGSAEADGLKTVYVVLIGFGVVLFIGAMAFSAVKFGGKGGM